MQQREKHDSSSSSTQQPIVVIHQIPLEATGQHKGKGYYADNLAFSCEDEALLTTRPASDVYAQLSHPVDHDGGLDETDTSYSVNKRLFWKAVLSGCTLAATIILLYLWIHVKYINPMFIEIFKISPPSQAIAMRVPKISSFTFLQSAKAATTDWKVEYDLPYGIPLIELHAKDMKDMTAIICPPSKFALALYLESDSELAEDWIKSCGHNAAYFRIDGDPTPHDVERLIPYLKDAQFLPLKATLKVEKGDDLLDNPDFQKTRMSDDVIKNVEISGYVTPQSIEELVEAVPFAEELTIRGDEVCKSLRRSLKTSEQVCKVHWEFLQKLHIVDTQECRGLYDLIYSCWDMPKIETLQIRKSIISSPNADYIKGILDRYRIIKVDFADNTCFDETLQTYPFMCQSSVLV